MNLNEKASYICEEMINFQDELKVGHLELENGAQLIDCGVKYPGSLEAGRLFALACMGDMAEIEFEMKDFEGLILPAVQVTTSHPAVACLASQKAGWNIKGDKFFALGSGPARILAEKPKETFNRLGYKEGSDTAVIALEASRYPTEEVAQMIADECGVPPENLYILVARTASIAGTVQISARVVETAIYKIDHMKYDTSGIGFAQGLAPIAPIVGDDTKMMGATNDMVIYGGSVYLAGNSNFNLKKIPSSTTGDYGKPFIDIFKEADYDFYKIDPGLFAPAEVLVNNIEEGKIERAGEINPSIIKESTGFE